MARQDGPGRQQHQRGHLARGSQRFCDSFFDSCSWLVLLARDLVDTRTPSMHDPRSISNFSKRSRSFHRLQERFLRQRASSRVSAILGSTFLSSGSQPILIADLNLGSFARVNEVSYPSAIAYRILASTSGREIVLSLVRFPM